MRTAVIVFPGSNCDRDAQVALHAATGAPPAMIWHRETALPPLDLIVLPGGFSYGDYLRSGAMAARSPVLRALHEQVERGVLVLGICNGFQVLTETELLPGVLMRNAGLNFVCRDVDLVVENTESPFTRGCAKGQSLTLPVAHHDGNYYADDATLDRLEGEGRVAFRYAPHDNPNGSARDIAGILNERGTVLGMMPHPERAVDPLHCGTDGRAVFAGLMEALAA
ncbi:MAG: phosphoribosylformylglycinamidine synthase subunit PurQ [Alphaproteobacteria bacterium]|nr:phosphoribosylformylglycinamidine synthase subunit PurQ [Alphaproteobacteria bacterium]